MAADAGNATIQFEATNSRDHFISAPIRFNSNTDVAAGAKTLTLSGQLDWNGKTVTVLNGALKLNNASATNITAGSTLAVNSGATAELAGTTSGTSSGANRVNVTNAGNLSVTGTNQAVGTIDGTGSTTVAQNANATANHIIQNSLTVQGITGAGNNLAKLTINNSTPVPQGNNTGASKLGTLAIDNNGAALGTRVYFGTVDLKDNDLLITGMSAQYANVRDMVRSGSAGSWTGKGLTSSEAASGTLAGLTALGAILNEDPIAAPGVAIKSSFSGFTGLAKTDILVKYTWVGDSNLDGIVNSVDTSLFLDGLVNQYSGWYYGDYNYDNTINSVDTSLFLDGIVNGTTSLPEPSTFVLGAFGLLGLLKLRRRGRRTL
jgi:hypothetical protein